MTGPAVASARLVAHWTRLYTAGLPAGARDRRRAEIAADIHGQLAEARRRRERPVVTAAMMLSRLVRGAWDDLSWRREVSGPARLARWQARRGWWIAGAVLITLAAGAAWLGFGVSLRSGGDQQPLRLATRAVSRLEAGSRPASILPPAINMTTSPAPFVMVFDRRHVLASSGRLNRRIPALPGGVLAWAARHGEDRITWEPQPGLREAAVIEPYGQPRRGFVLAAQSLQTISARQRTLTWAVACCWLAALTMSFQITRLLPGRIGPPHTPAR